MTTADYSVFQKLVQAYYRQHGRHDLPWRHTANGFFDPYEIMVSELMLQQTQVGRVIPKYSSFLTAFPTVSRLAAAPLGAVLTAWSGLGYNRRAKYLQQAAQAIAGQGTFPATGAELQRLPGVGVNTAAAIRAYAFDEPVVFIETNIRSVFIHHFFQDEAAVTDRQILELVQRTLPPSSPREWYWALMDYGSHLKQTQRHAARRSTSYTPQSAFQGSLRQLRGQVIKRLTEQPLTVGELRAVINDERLSAVVEVLISEQMINRRGQQLHI